ncbi:hypothetical protein B0H11DRAFT_1905073 [Mycena galericulata]|nr:hypothetical protein B0H11DRAFT_1905073 [Mycena galericulata]
MPFPSTFSREVIDVSDAIDSSPDSEVINVDALETPEVIALDSTASREVIDVDALETHEVIHGDALDSLYTCPIDVDALDNPLPSGVVQPSINADSISMETGGCWAWIDLNASEKYSAKRKCHNSKATSIARPRTTPPDYARSSSVMSMVAFEEFRHLFVDCTWCVQPGRHPRCVWTVSALYDQIKAAGRCGLCVLFRFPDEDDVKYGCTTLAMANPDSRLRLPITLPVLSNLALRHITLVPPIRVPVIERRGVPDRQEFYRALRRHLGSNYFWGETQSFRELVLSDLVPAREEHRPSHTLLAGACTSLYGPKKPTS